MKPANRRALLKPLGLLVLIGAIGGAAVFLSSLFASEAVQAPTMSLDMITTGNGYCDGAGTCTGVPGPGTNQMFVGPVDPCLASPIANTATHIHVAHLIIQNVEDLVGWQARFNYVGDQMRPLNANFLPFTDSATFQGISFNNLPLDAGAHRDLTTASSIPAGAAGPQTALIGATYLGAQTFPVSPDTPAKPVPDDTSYSAPTGGVLAAVVLQVVGNQSGNTLAMNLGTAPNPPSNVVVFNGTGTTTINLASSALGSGFHAEGAATCSLPGTRAPTPTLPPPLPTASPLPTLSPLLAQPTSLTQAWDLAQTRAVQWQSDAALAQLSSTYIGDTPSAQSGLDGKRRSWQAVAVAPSAPGRQLLMQIRDGAVVEASERLGPSLQPIQQKPTIDSPAAIAAAFAAKPGFGPGSAKLPGLHFAVQLFPNTSVASVRVIGSYRSEDAFIEIDGLTGRFLRAQARLLAEGGGLLHSQDGGLSWQGSNLRGLMITSLATDPRQSRVGYASAAQNLGITIYRTSDGGANWAQAGRLPDEAGTWPSSMAVTTADGGAPVLLVGTLNGLWVSRDGGGTWSKVRTLPDGAAPAVAVTENSTARLFLAVQVNANSAGAALFSSRDLAVWTIEAQGWYRLSQSVDRGSVLAINESQPDRGILFGPGGRSSVQLPARLAPSVAVPQTVLRAAGSFDSSAPMIAEGSNRIEFSGDGGATWRITLEASLGSLSAAPDFASSGVAVAGGFRTGIYLTRDGGRTWSVASDRPSQIVAGSGEIGPVAFFSPTDVAAANGALPTWVDF